MIVASAVGLLVAAGFALHFYLRWQTARLRAELIAKGEKLTIEELVPKRPTADENGAPRLLNVIMRLRAGTNTVLDKNPPPAMRSVAPGRAMVGWQQSEIRSAGRNTKTNTWAELRAELAERASIFGELGVALQSQAFDFNINYAQFGVQQHFTGLKNASSILKSVTELHLHDQKLDAAFQDLLLQVDLVQVLQNEPLLISQLIRLAESSLALTATWEALQSEGWIDAQLTEIQRHWASQDFIKPFLAALTMERAMMLDTIARSREDSGYRQRYFTQTAPDKDDLLERPLEVLQSQLEVLLWLPFLSYRAERDCLDLDQAVLEALRSAATNASYLEARERTIASLANFGFPRSALISNSGELKDIMTPGFIWLRTLLRPFEAQTQAQLATTAIALKRYQLRHHKLPNDLSALVPEFLAEVPRDPMNGQTLHYRPNTNSTFLLYSVGIDGEDNGGDPTLRKGAMNKTWLGGRDLVWPQPASEEEVEEYYATQAGRKPAGRSH